MHSGVIGVIIVIATGAPASAVAAVEDRALIALACQTPPGSVRIVSAIRS